MKEPELLLFFRGAIYQCACNEDGVFSQSQLALCFELPEQADLDNFRKANILLFPPNMKLDSFEFDPECPKNYCAEDLGFKEVKMGCSPEIIEEANDIKAIRRQCGLRHYVTSAVHRAMGDAHHKMATSISASNKLLKLWDRGQLIAILSRTRLMKNTIFVGDKQDTIAGLKLFLTKRTQWSDYVNQVIDIITVNEEEANFNNNVSLDQSNYPFRIADIALPQDQTGSVCIMMSKKDTSFVHIDSAMCARSSLIAHNSGCNVRTDLPYNLRPFVLIACICGFDRNKESMHAIKEN